MKNYESVLLFDPNLEEDAVDELIEKASEKISGKKGEVLHVEKWGKKQLAYEINKFTRAHYVVLTFKSEPEHIKYYERQYTISEPIIRCLTICKEEKLPKAHESAPVEEG